MNNENLKIKLMREKEFHEVRIREIEDELRRIEAQQNKQVEVITSTYDISGD